jgi:predicted TIM-barrel fold metal-dependent hydrolase
MVTTVRIDVHQHLWTEPLVDALERRARLPFVRREDGLCTIHVAGETPSGIDLESERPPVRAALLAQDGVDRALIALSSPLGIEALPRAEAQGLIDAHLDGVAALRERFGVWGPLALDGLRSDDVDAVLERECVGVSLPAGAFEPPSSIDALRPVLARLERLDVPLFIHPGPGLGTTPGECSLADPLWWPALTRYVAQMQAAWLAISTLARRAHPRLRVVFAMLAGGAPLLSERLAARGGPAVDIRDPYSFYDISSYGPVAIEAMARRVGGQQLLYGSDRPVIEPLASGRNALLHENAGWLAARSRAAA